MKKDIYFDDFFGPGWPTLSELEPYFLAPRGKEWFYTGGNDSGGLSIEGLDGTDQLPYGRGRKDIRLSMYGNPELGVLLQYSRIGGMPRQDWFSKGDMTKIRQWVRTLHDDPMPVGLFIPFDQAWLAVKEFMETEGNLPTGIEWVSSNDIPDNTFPDPTVRLPGEPDKGWPPLL
jgi:Immunity protein Imm1